MTAAISKREERWGTSLTNAMFNDSTIRSDSTKIKNKYYPNSIRFTEKHMKRAREKTARRTLNSVQALADAYHLSRLSEKIILTITSKLKIILTMTSSLKTVSVCGSQPAHEFMSFLVR